MKKIAYCILTILASLFFSCRERNSDGDNYETISINIEKRDAIDIRDSSRISRTIPLELTGDSPLSYIEQIEYHDDRIYLYDTHRVLVFDETGKYLFDVGSRGRGPGEYTNINSFFLKEGQICIYDDNVRSVLSYDPDGVFTGSKMIEEELSSVYPIHDGKYIGRRKFQGESVKTPALAVLDNKLKTATHSGNRYLTTGVRTFDFVCSYDKSVLYWEFLNDTIFSVANSKIVPLYHVDFGNNGVPPVRKKNKTIGEIIEYIDTHGSNFATGIRYVHEDAFNIRFIFMFGENIHYANYNKETKEISLSYFHDSKNQFKFQYFMKYRNGEIILSVYDSNSEDNPHLLFVKEEY
jgi:hypothetical protein